MKNFIEAVNRLQTICTDVYLKVANSLTTGMSEKDIEGSIFEHLKFLNINNFWYDVPIFVLIGENRFRNMAAKNYSLKRPTESVSLRRGDVIFIDMHPMDDLGYWGDFSWMSVFKPKDSDNEKIEFLKLILDIHRDGIKNISPKMTGADLSNWYLERYKEEGITHQDARENIGHSMTSGTKKDSKGKYRISFLDKNNHDVLAGGIYSIEPGGFRPRKDSKGMVVGRFEECVYIPVSGKPVILGGYEPLPLVI